MLPESMLEERVAQVEKDLADLKSQMERLRRERGGINKITRSSKDDREILEIPRPDGQRYRLTRLSDEQGYDLRRWSIAINVDLPLELVVPRSDQLGLAETYAVCRHLFGERGRGFDRWKGGFAFPFALEVPGAARCPAYLLDVMNYRSGLEYFLRKLVDPSDERLQNSIYYPPDAAEFPRAEIHRLVAFFVGFLEGYFQSLRLFWEERFLLAVESNAILYGFDGKEFFTRHFESSEEFEKTRATLAERLPVPGFYARDSGVGKSSS
jgi:hypothetical protein